MTRPTILLEGGRTAHSALKSPLNIQSNETPTCNISKNSAMTKILQQCNLIVWDESTMAHKKSLEALDRTMKDPRFFLLLPGEGSYKRNN